MESGFEDMRSDEEELEDLEPPTSKFRTQGQLMSYEEDPNFEGYLQVKVWRGGRGERRVERWRGGEVAMVRSIKKKWGEEKRRRKSE